MDSQTKSNASVLVLGGPATGKTHYGGQLYGRLRKGGAAISLRTTPESLTLFETVLNSLNNGYEAAHTPGSSYSEIVLPLQWGDIASFNLVWPDYGGEQVNTMMEQRKINPEWQQNVENATGWLLFLRPDRLHEGQDSFSRPIETLLSHKDAVAGPVRWSEQAYLIEFLQLLLYTRKVEMVKQLKHPPLGIVLSCWDEIAAPSGKQPKMLLQEKLPLFADFVEATWTSEAYFVIGLSSTERPLNDKQADEGYIDQGPENFGYTIGADGTKNPDLTLPLVELLGRF